MKDIEAGDINIHDLRDLKRNTKIEKTNTDRGYHVTDPLCQQSIKEEQVEEDVPAHPKIDLADDTYDIDIDLEDVEQKMKDELDDEVNKKFISSVQGKDSKNANEDLNMDDNEYAEDFEE
jgi:hypothetical protein